MPPSHKIFLKNLPHSATASEIKALFATHHPLQAELIPKLPGCAVVGFRTKAEARQSVEDFEDLVFQGVQVDVRLYRKSKKQTEKGMERHGNERWGKAVDSPEHGSQSAEGKSGLDGEGEHAVDDYFSLKPEQPASSKPVPASEFKIPRSTTPMGNDNNTATHDSSILSSLIITDNSGSSLTQPLRRKLFGQRNRIGPPVIHGLTDLSTKDLSTPELGLLPIPKQSSPTFAATAPTFAKSNSRFSATAPSPKLAPLKMNSGRVGFSNTKVEVIPHRNGDNLRSISKNSKAEVKPHYSIDGLGAVREGSRVSPEEKRQRVASWSQEPPSSSNVASAGKRPSHNYSGSLRHLLKSTVPGTEDGVAGNKTEIGVETTLEDGSNTFNDDRSHHFDNADIESNPFNNWKPSGVQGYGEHLNGHEDNQSLQRMEQNTNVYSSPGPTSPYIQQKLGLYSSPGLAHLPHAQALPTQGTINPYASPGPANPHSTPDPQNPLNSQIRHTPFASQLKHSTADSTICIPPGYEVHAYTFADPSSQRLTPEQLRGQRMNQQYLRGETPQPPPYVYGTMPTYPVDNGPANPLTWKQLQEQRHVENRERALHEAGFGQQHLRGAGDGSADEERGTNWELGMRPLQGARAQHVPDCTLCQRMEKWHKCPKPTHLHWH